MDVSPFLPPNREAARRDSRPEVSENFPLRLRARKHFFDNKMKTEAFPGMSRCVTPFCREPARQFGIGLGLGGIVISPSMTYREEAGAAGPSALVARQLLDFPRKAD